MLLYPWLILRVVVRVGLVFRVVYQNVSRILFPSLCLLLLLMTFLC